MLLGLLKKFGLLAFETIKVIAISMAIILPIRYFLIQPFYVEGASMEPNFESHEYLIIDEVSYRLRSPQRGDVIVFRYPHDPKQFYIKRVIGLPGETVAINSGQVVVNDRPLEEDYLSELNLSKSSLGEKVIGADEYFVLGDNRANSSDSRVFGPIKRSYIVGRVWLRGWPIDRLSVFSTPQYQ